jgi:cytidylate kinase
MTVITISRQFGAGGRTLGMMVAEKLNYKFLDDTVIQELSARLKVSRESVTDIENIAGGLFSKIVSTMLSRSYMERICGDEAGYIDENIYIEKLKEVIIDLAKQDNIILLGRGSQYILASQENTYHFLLVADMAQRIRFMQEHYKMTDSKARQAVLGGEKRRQNVYAKLGMTTYDDPLNYHMVLNMSRLTLEQAKNTIINLVSRTA